MLTDVKGSVRTPEYEQAYVELAAKTRSLFDLMTANKKGESRFFLEGHMSQGGLEITIQTAELKDPLIHIKQLDAVRGITTLEVRETEVVKYGEYNWGQSSIKVDPGDAQRMDFGDLQRLHAFLVSPRFDNQAFRKLQLVAKLQTP